MYECMSVCVYVCMFVCLVPYLLVISWSQSQTGEPLSFLRIGVPTSTKVREPYTSAREEWVRIFLNLYLKIEEIFRKYVQKYRSVKIQIHTFLVFLGLGLAELHCDD